MSSKQELVEKSIKGKFDSLLHWPFTWNTFCLLAHSVEPENGCSLMQPIRIHFDPAKVAYLNFNYERHCSSYVFDVNLYILDWLSSRYPELYSKYYLRFNMVSDFVMLTVSAYPFATRHQLMLIGRIIFWGFSIDDQVLERFENESVGIAYADKFMRLLEDGNVTGDDQFCEFCGMLIEAYIEFKVYMSPAQQRRFIDYTRKYILATAKESRLKLQRQSLHITIAEYLSMRQTSVGSHLYQLLAEVVACSDVSTLLHEAQADADVCENVDSIADMFSCINDLYSYNKECTELDMATNLVKLIQTQRPQMSPAEAVEIAIDELLRHKQRFDRTSQTLIAKYDRPEHRSMNLPGYIRNMSIWVQAIIVFHYNAIRYVKHVRPHLAPK